ncbi:MAG: MFS transporter [Ruminococcaceae bacterium]|nr:MFS transporter [Oscillospiraceae bacterium]
MSTFSSAAEKRGRLMYILEAALEYFIALLVAGSFLATLTKELGFSDSLTGILSSVISLGCLFQLFSIFLRPKKNKGFIIVLSVVNQFLFMLLYVIPLLETKGSIKTVLFVVTIVGAYFVYNVVHPKKINWLMSMVEDFKRGEFTAVKEIVSLFSGMAFTFIMGAVTDYFKDRGEIKTAFIVSAVTIFSCMTLHTVTMLLTPSKDEKPDEKKKLLVNIKETFKNKDLMIITGVFVLYYIAKGVCVPFYGSYVINELGFSLKTVSALAMVSSISRIIASLFMGKYADKKSFAAMIEVCFVFLAVAFIFGALSGIGTFGKIMFTLYYVFHGISQSGINSAFINMVFDYVPNEKRADSLAICQAVSGVVGFVTTLFAGALLSYIQGIGNNIFGIDLYAQQLMSLIGAVFAVITIIYVRKIVIKNK